ncbi:hypothetical protein [Paenibacillus sp. SN-8-1]|uniref:hypothetical protein n=1 Tax=Paenibacillus sp. SN-8-1 TaxID=3435409 RepID=UPI003D9A8E2E
MAKKDKWRKWKVSAAGILAAGLALQWLKSTPAFETASQQVAALDSASGAVDQTNNTNNTNSDSAINDWQNNMDQNQFQGGNSRHGRQRDFQYNDSNSDSYNSLNDSSSNDNSGNGSYDDSSSGGFSEQAPSSSFETRTGGS